MAKLRAEKDAALAALAAQHQQELAALQALDTQPVHYLTPCLSPV